MKNRKVYIGIALLIVVLLLGIGYASITSTTLTISGSAAAGTDSANFVVKLTGTPTVSDEDNVEATITDDITATISVEGLTAKGDKETATYTISNESPDLSASLSAVVTQNTNSEYFRVTPTFAQTTVNAQTTTTVEVEVELIKTPIDNDQTSNITVTITADPVQPTTGA